MTTFGAGYAQDVTATIRAARLGDADALGEVHVAAWQWAYRGLMPDDLLDSLRPDARARAWKAWLSGDDAGESFAAWVAEQDGRIVGFASSNDARDPDLDEGAVELLTIYLLEPVVRTGLGTRLLDAAEEAWRRDGRRTAVLWVPADSDRTRRFYEDHGWAADGTTKHQSFGAATQVNVVRYVKDLTRPAP